MLKLIFVIAIVIFGLYWFSRKKKEGGGNWVQFISMGKEAGFSFKEVEMLRQSLSPGTVTAWAVLVVSCVSSAYLEESYFRFYLFSKKEEMGLGPHRAVLVSTLLFSICHIYEGPWGFLNAALSGVVLAYVFLRFRSLHGVAAAHALYNILAYVLQARTG